MICLIETWKRDLDVFFRFHSDEKNKFFNFTKHLIEEISGVKIADTHHTLYFIFGQGTS